MQVAPTQTSPKCQVVVTRRSTARCSSAVGLGAPASRNLFGVEPHDPMALAGATALLLAMALIAAYMPARRASRIDPFSALRHE